MKATIASLLLLSAVHASAAFSINLPGNTETGTWSGLNNANYPSAVPTPENPTPPNALDVLGAISASGSSATFDKVSGGAYFISTNSGIYGGAAGPSAFSISDASPILDLATIVFQARTNTPPGSFSVTLSLNGNTTGPLAGLVPDFAMQALVQGTTFDRAWQWDLSGITEEITSYEISFGTPMHALIDVTSPVSVHTSDSFVQVVPEPTTGLLAIAPLAFVVLRRRRAA